MKILSPKNLRQISLLINVFLALNLSAQIDELTLPTYRLEIDTLHLQSLNDDPWTEEYFPAVFSYNEYQYDCEVRYRGGTSRELPKKSWRIKFEDDSNYFGVEKLNLNAEYTDRSLMRNYLAMTLFQEMEYPAPTTQFISYIVNGQYFGVHVSVEQVDEFFLERNDRQASTLYKAERNGASMTPLVRYEDYFSSWEKRIGNPLDYTDIQLLFNKFMYWTNEDFLTLIGTEVDIDNILNYFAIEFFIVSYDCFTKNFFLYYNPDLNVYELFPWDNDAILGNEFRGNYHPEYASFYHNAPISNHILFQRLMENETWRDIFWNKIEHIRNTGVSFLNTQIDTTYARIRNDVYLDTNKICENHEFDAEIIRLHDFLEARQSFLEGFRYFERKTLYDMYCSSTNPTADNPRVQFNATVLEPQNISVRLIRNLNFDVWGDHFTTSYLPLYDDGNHGDYLAGDLIYGNSIDINGSSDEIIPYYFKASGYDYPANGGFYLNYINTNTFALLPTEAAQNLDQNLRIGDIYNIGNDYFVELCNLDSNSLNLSYHHLQAGPYFQHFILPEHTVLAPNDTLIVTTNEIMSSAIFNHHGSLGNFYFNIDLEDSIKVLAPDLSPVITKVCDEFTPFTASSPPIIINEINYNSSDEFETGDWVELYNPNNFPIELSSWIFKDEDDTHTFIIPEATIIESEGYLVLCGNESFFRTLFPEVENWVSEFDFGLSGWGELVRLYSETGLLVDSVRYDDHAPWPSAADGEGSTLQLIDVEMDNSIAESWGASHIYGSPGSENIGFLNIEGQQILGFKLMPNYPNPFNASTVIPYSIQHSGIVRIDIFDISGRSVQNLVSANQSPGEYKIFFDATGLSSGVYLCRVLFNENLIGNQKLVLLR